MARLVQSLVFGSTFNRNLENVTLLSITQCLTFDVTLNRNLEHAVLPGNTQSSTVGAMFNLNLMNVTPPNDVQSLHLPECVSTHFAAVATLCMWGACPLLLVSP
jgi:hypothetical protein